MNKARLALQFGSNIPIRGALTLAAIFWAIGLAMVSHQSDAAQCKVMCDSSPHIWAMVMLLDAVLLGWRIFERRTRPHMGRLINAMTSALWLSITTSTLVESGFLAAASGMTFFIMSVWAALRTDLTPGDKETV